jgi:FkbM family methyltransferase
VFEYAREEIALITSGTGLGNRFRLAAMSVRLHLAARGLSLPGRDREHELRLQGLNLRVRANDFVLFEILGFGGYDVDLTRLGTITTVLDIGANIGLATIFLSRWLPDAAFFCVEPSRQSHDLLVRNLRRNVRRAVALRAAATVEPKTVTVLEGSHPGLTSVRAADRSCGDEVPGMTINALLDAAGFAQVGLMKLDIEGGERELIMDAASWSDRVGAVLAEIHAPLTVQGAAGHLAEHGYQRLPLPPSPRFADLLLVKRRVAPKTA